MKKCFFTFFIIGFYQIQIIAQTSDELIKFNQAIDLAVIEKDTIFLKSAYSDDYVFTHGTGLIDSRQSWIQAIKRNTYLLRQHDSVTVEHHKPFIYILHGTLTVKRMDKTNLVHYALNYIRVYIKIKKKLQMVSHWTTKEWHLN
jgi:hypothetical protein